MSKETGASRSISWRYYSGSPVDFYWIWILFGLVWLAWALIIGGGFPSRPDSTPSMDRMIESIACYTPPLEEAPATESGGDTSAGMAEFPLTADCDIAKAAIAGWIKIADGAQLELTDAEESATGHFDSNWKNNYICPTSPAWGENRPMIAHIVASGAVEGCEGAQWTARLPLVRNTQIETSWAQFISFVLIVVPIVALLFFMARSWRTRAAFRWLYHSQHG